MPQLVPQSTDPGANRLPDAVRRVLVVDDSRAQRKVVAVSLSRQGFDVVEAGSGEEALDILRTTTVDLVLSDWMMPGMNGLELCRRVRALSGETYVYFILLTSKNEKGAVAQGLDFGADDFLTKPVNPDELRARIHAGDRILKMTRELSEKNRLISATLEEISTLYEALDRDLVNARKMQLALLRETYRDFGAADLALMLKPSGHVGGDLVGFFEAGRNRVAVYSLDVSGHGVASALLTARLSSYLSDGAPGQNVALQEVAESMYFGRPPVEVAQALNRIMLGDLGADLYFTIVFGYLDLKTGVFDYTQCGHPNPILIDAEGGVSFFGEGGMPIGLFDDVEFTQHQITLSPGDRLLFYSDGFTECADPEGRMLDEDGFARLIEDNTDLESNAFLESLLWNLDAYNGGGEFGDDLSAALLRYRGPGDQAK